jgi:cytochrome b6-f complex iron-sulfur subunit
MKRRELLVAAVGTATLACTGCSSGSEQGARTVSLGAIDTYSHGITPLPMHRLAVIRDDRGFGVMSLVCTHQLCVVAQQGHRFVCPCHGSEFSEEGRVLIGPASADLPWYAVTIQHPGILSVDLAQRVTSDVRVALKPVS